MCNCIEQKEAELQKATGDEEAFLQTVFDIKNKNRVFNAKAFYRKKNIIGRYKKNYFLSHILFEYCPFCGKKYNGEANNG